MFVSVFDMFKVGVGPSSSHTIGPMVAAARFLDHLRAQPFAVAGVRVSLHGSLAFTGVGHATDRAVILGLTGMRADAYDADIAEAALEQVKQTAQVAPMGRPVLRFHPKDDLIFDYGPALPGHANGMIFKSLDSQGDTVTQVTYYSIGGGFVLTEAEHAAGRDADSGPPIPYPFSTATQMVQMAESSGKSIAQLKRDNERSRRTSPDLDAGLQNIWAVMSDCIDRGLATDGILPGGLKVRRRARGIHQALLAERGMNQPAPHTINDWMSAYAMAVNEENAAGGRVVTAPTNGAAGVIPATIRYWLDHVPGASAAGVPDFLLTAAAIGGLIKFNASISGAEYGCQAEVGSAAAMAAAGLCAVLGGSPAQIENAA
ncbi:MAG: L-serine ammonia-lyase, partial [Alphaproteobacteria bacterium]|nr:L-serine ammonia-lyase [Alphaproteobacteria bacterium]